MFNISDLYQEVIIDHNRNPRNFGKLEHPSQTAQGYSPLCGDKLNLYLKLNNGHIEDMCFDGSGCAISVASASLMTEALKKKPVKEAEHLFHIFHDLIIADGEPTPDQLTALGKLATLMGVKAYPMRVKCATLCWHALHSALQGKTSPVLID